MIPSKTLHSLERCRKRALSNDLVLLHCGLNQGYMSTYTHVQRKVDYTKLGALAEIYAEQV
jgi:hypothetical protein